VIAPLIVVAGLALAQADAPSAKDTTSPKDAAAAKAALADKVKKLIVQLDDDSQARRDAAEKALIELGTDVLDVLPPAGPKASIELRARLARVRSTVEKAYVEAFTKPAVVTLQGKMKLSAAIGDIEKQSGNTLIDAREQFNQQPDNIDVEIDVKNASFWEALDKLLDEAGMTVYTYNDLPNQLRLMNANPGDAPRAERASYAGLFRLEAKSLDATRDFRNPMGSGLRIGTDITWEPRLRPIVLLLQLAELQATDDTGAEIPATGEGEIEVPIEGNNTGVEMDLYLKLPKRSAAKVSSVKGKFQALMPGRVEKFEFAGLDKAKDVALERGAAVVTLQQVRKNDEVYEVLIRLKFDEAENALESHRGWVQENSAYILDPKGDKIEDGGSSFSNIAENEVGISYIFDLADTPLAKCRFVYETPAGLFKIPVEFELKDLELP